MTDNTPTLCRDCSESTSGQCWRHGGSYYTATTDDVMPPVAPYEVCRTCWSLVFPGQMVGHHVSLHREVTDE